VELDNTKNDRIRRADARLKLVKRVDEVAQALESLHVALSNAHPEDVLVLAAEYPFPNMHNNVRHDTADVTRAAMLWSANLHESGRWKDLGTRRFPENVTPALQRQCAQLCKRCAAAIAFDVPRYKDALWQHADGTPCEAHTLLTPANGTKVPG